MGEISIYCTEGYKTYGNGEISLICCGIREKIEGVYKWACWRRKAVSEARITKVMSMAFVLLNHFVKGDNVGDDNTGYIMIAFFGWWLYLSLLVLAYIAIVLFECYFVECECKYGGGKV